MYLDDLDEDEYEIAIKVSSLDDAAAGLGEPKKFGGGMEGVGQVPNSFLTSSQFWAKESHFLGVGQ